MGRSSSSRNNNIGSSSASSSLAASASSVALMGFHMLYAVAGGGSKSGGGGGGSKRWSDGGTDEHDTELEDALPVVGSDDGGDGHEHGHEDDASPRRPPAAFKKSPSMRLRKSPRRDKRSHMPRSPVLTRSMRRLSNAANSANDDDVAHPPNANADDSAGAAATPSSASTEGELAEARREITRLRDRIVSYQKELTDLEGENDRANLWIAELEDRERAQGEAIKQIALMQTSPSSSQQATCQPEGCSSQQPWHDDSETEEAVQCRAEKDGLRKKLLRLESDLEDARERNAQLEKTKEGMGMALKMFKEREEKQSGSKDKLRTLRVRVTDLEEQLAGSEEALRESQEWIDELEAKAKTAADEEDARTAELDAKVRELERNLASKETELRQSREWIAELEGREKAQTEAMLQLAAMRSRMRENETEKERELDRARKEKVRMDIELRDARDQVFALAAENRELEKAAGKLRDESRRRKIVEAAADRRSRERAVELERQIEVLNQKLECQAETHAKERRALQSQLLRSMRGATTTATATATEAPSGEGKENVDGAAAPAPPSAESSRSSPKPAAAREASAQSGYERVYKKWEVFGQNGGQGQQQQGGDRVKQQEQQPRRQSRESDHGGGRSASQCDRSIGQSPTSTFDYEDSDDSDGDDDDDDGMGGWQNVMRKSPYEPDYSVSSADPTHDAGGSPPPPQQRPSGDGAGAERGAHYHGYRRDRPSAHQSTSHSSRHDRSQSDGGGTSSGDYGPRQSRWRRRPDRGHDTDDAEDNGDSLSDKEGTLYEVLGLSPSATAADIKRSYRRLALRYHPDKNGGDPVSAETFRRVSEAYDVLSDETRRRDYDDKLAWRR